MQQALEALEWNYNTDLDNISACEQWAKMLEETITALRAALAEPEQEPVARAWQEGYNQGIEDERISEANIGICGFGAKVEPARQNPYKTTAPTPRKPVEKGTEMSTSFDVRQWADQAGIQTTGGFAVVAECVTLDELQRFAQIAMEAAAIELVRKNNRLDCIASELQDTCHKQAQKIAKDESLLRQALEVLNDIREATAQSPKVFRFEALVARLRERVGGETEMVESPTPRKPLTDERLRKCAQAMDAEPLAEGWPELVKFARAIERAHGINEQEHE
jgi:hypothetical protein